MLIKQLTELIDLRNTHATELFVDCPVLFGQVITVVDAPSGHVLMSKRFKILRSKTLHLQNTAHNMNGDDSDWEAFEWWLIPIFVE